ncbi:MAG TPA: group 1 glycosyl transferase, partial [Candidatus Omnitrophica bacterium]|nr:group 1 glycosyl transferase [Candidatus Omnitrophota bacterium]
MKVLHVIPFLSGSCGGPVQAVTQLCQELRNQGVETAIATTTIDQDKTRVIPDFVPVYSFGRQ